MDLKDIGETNLACIPKDISLIWEGEQTRMINNDITEIDYTNYLKGERDIIEYYYTDIHFSYYKESERKNQLTKASSYFAHGGKSRLYIQEIIQGSLVTFVE